MKMLGLCELEVHDQPKYAVYLDGDRKTGYCVDKNTAIRRINGKGFGDADKYPPKKIIVPLEMM